MINLFTSSNYNKRSGKNSSILPSAPLKKIDNNKITTIMIKSQFTNSDYNKRS